MSTMAAGMIDVNLNMFEHGAAHLFARNETNTEESHHLREVKKNVQP